MMMARNSLETFLGGMETVQVVPNSALTEVLETFLGGMETGIGGERMKKASTP